MSIGMGYRIPSSNRGQPLTLPDFCYGCVTEADADRIADGMRQQNGREPGWQAVRGALIRLARCRTAQGDGKAGA
jgi:hypothetical protein